MALRDVKTKLKKKANEANEKAKRAAAQANQAAKKNQPAKKTGVKQAAKTGGNKVTYYSKNQKARNMGRKVSQGVGQAVKSNARANQALQKAPSKAQNRYSSRKRAQAGVQYSKTGLPDYRMVGDLSKFPRHKGLNTTSPIDQAFRSLYVSQDPTAMTMGIRERTNLMAPLDLARADSMTGQGNWQSDTGYKRKEKSDKEKAKDILNNAKAAMRNQKVKRQERKLSEYDKKYQNDARQHQIAEAKLRYAEASAKGDKAGAAKAHQDADALRASLGYSGGAAGDQYITPDVPQDVRNRLNERGILEWKKAQMNRQRAVTEDEIARADRRLDEVLRARGYQKDVGNLDSGWTYDANGRRVWSGTREQNLADARQGQAALQATGEGIVGGLAYAGQIANRANRDRYEDANINRWIEEAGDLIPAQQALSRYDDYVRQFGEPPEDMPNRNVLVMRLNQARQAQAQLDRIQGDVDSLYFDPTVAERLGLPTTRGETFGERMLRQAAEHQAEATEGMNGAERFITDAMISTGQSLPGMMLAAIPGVGLPASMTVLGAQAMGSRAYDLRQQGLTNEDAYLRGLISGGIEVATEIIPVAHWVNILKGKTGRTAIKNILKQAGEEGTEETVSYLANLAVDKAAGDPNAAFSLVDLLENAGMGALSGGILGGGAAVFAEGRGRPQSRETAPQIQTPEIQARTAEQAETISQAQDIQSDVRTEAARQLLADTQAYNEMKRTGALSSAELSMVKETLDSRLVQLTGQQAPQVSQTPQITQAPQTTQSSQMVQTPQITQTPQRAQVSQNTQVPVEFPPVERTRFPASSFIGSFIDAARENNARRQAAEQARTVREQMQQTPQAETAVQIPVAQRETREATRQENPVLTQSAATNSAISAVAKTLGENGARSLTTAVERNPEAVGNFIRVYNQARDGQTNIERPESMNKAQYTAAVFSGQNDKASGLAREVLRASNAAGRNKNAGVDWSDRYVRQMDRKTARTVDGLAKALGVKVVFAEQGSILTAGGAAANAEITGNVVRIEKGNPNPVRSLIGHELTHRMQDVSPESYRAFRDYVMSIPGSMEAMERTVSLYQGAKAFRSEDNARQMAMDEVTADYAGDLLENSEQLQEFIRRNYENRTLLETIRDFFRDLAAKLTGRQKAQADEAVRLLEEAIKGAEKSLKKSENVGTFDRGDPDTRYSIGTGGFDQAKLMRENQLLRDRAEYWKAQTKRSDRTKTDPKEVRKLAKKLAGDFSSTMDTAEIAGELQTIYDGLGKDWTYDQAYEAAHALAMNMVEQASESDGFLYNEYEPMRKFFRETALVLSPSDRGQITDYNDWRKAQMGRLRIQHGDQSNLDQVYQEVSQLWPEWFDEERDVTSLDQLERIAEVMDSIYTQEETNPFQDDLEAPAGYLTAEIMENFWDLPNVKKTYADRAEARLGREVTRRLDMQEKYQEKLRQVREDRDAKLRRKSEEYLGRTRARSQRQKERERRAQIMRHARELSKKLLKPSDKQHIPQQLREAVAAVLDSVNLSSKNFKDTNRTRAFQELRLAYQDILQQGESLVIDPDLMDNISEVEAMRDTPIAEMNLSQLETIWKTIRAVEASITTANKAFGQQRFATIFEAADGLRQAMQSRRDRGDYRGPVGAFDKLLNSGMLTPESYFHRMGQTGQDIFRMLRNAQDRHIGIMQEAQDYTEGALFEKLLKEKPSKNPVRKAAQDEKLRKMQRKMEKEIHTFDFDGQKVQLTTAQIMSLHELLKRQQAVDHIVVGGIKPEGVDRGVKKKAPSEPYRLTTDQISEIVDSLTEEQVQMADALQKFMSGRLSQLGNEASMAVYGYEKFKEKNYFPIKVDKNQTVTDQTKEAQAATIAGRGFTKSTTPKANNALVVRNIFDVYADHVTDMATYSSWLEAMENLQRIYNFTFRDADNNRTGTTKGYLERAFGTNGLSYWEKLTEDLNNGVHGTNDNPFNSLIGNYKASAIGANIRVFVQQPTAILRALDDINPVDFLAGLGRGTVFTTWKKVKKYAPIAVWKDWGYFDADTGRQMKSILFGDDSALAKVNNGLMVPAGFMDSVGWSHIWNALEAETRRTRKDLKPRTEAFYQAVAARFNAVIDHSQVVDGILQRSQVMRSPDALTKMATSFMAEPTKVYNMFTTAVYDLKHSQDPKARTQAMKVLGRTTFALIASFFANAAAQSLVDALRDDDKDEEYWEKFFQAFYGLEGDEETTGAKIKNGILEGNLGAAFNPATYIPWAKDIVSLAQGFKVSRMDMDSISKFVQEIGSTWKAFHGDGKITLQNALARLTAEGARLLGVPVANIKRDVLAIYSTVMNGQKNYLGQFELQKWLYRMDNTNNQTDFVKIAYAAQQAGDTVAYEKIKAELVEAMGQEKFDAKMKNLAKKAMETGGDQEAAFTGIYETYETQMAGNPLYNDMPAEQRTKVEASLKQYAGDQVMLDASNGEITSADTEMAAIKEAEDAGIDPVTYKTFRVYYNGLASDKDENGDDIPGQTKQDKTIRAIEELELNKEQSSYLYHTCYSSDKNNPWA